MPRNTARRFRGRARQACSAASEEPDFKRSGLMPPEITRLFKAARSCRNARAHVCGIEPECLLPCEAAQLFARATVPRRTHACFLCSRCPRCLTTGPAQDAVPC